MKRYIDAEKLKAEIQRRSMHAYEAITADEPKYRTHYKLGRYEGLRDLIDIIDSLQQDETQVDRMLCSQVWWEEQGWIMIPPDATIEGIDSLLRQVKKKLQQERPSNWDDGKFVKILVQKEFAEQLQKLGDEIQTGQSSFVAAMKEQEQPEVDLKKEMEEYFGENWKDGTSIEVQDDMIKFALHFWNKGYNARKDALLKWIDEYKNYSSGPSWELLKTHIETL